MALTDAKGLKMRRSLKSVQMLLQNERSFGVSLIVLMIWGRSSSSMQSSLVTEMVALQVFHFSHHYFQTRLQILHHFH